MLKKFVRQWLCEHKHQSLIKKETITLSVSNNEDTDGSNKTLSIKIKSQCKDCGKIIKWEYKD